MKSPQYKRRTYIIKKTIASLPREDRRSALVIDDSLFSCNHSEKMELMVRIYDHVSDTYL